MAKADLTAQRLRELLDYDPLTGLFVWRVRAANIKPGTVTGAKSSNKTGYAQIGIAGKIYYGHRLAWLYVYGEWPKLHIDHINGNKANNWIANLRDVDRSTNLQNMRGPTANNKSSGVMGVRWSARENRWVARIRIGGKLKHIGQYTDKGVAARAYLEAKRSLHAGCTI